MPHDYLERAQESMRKIAREFEGKVFEKLLETNFPEMYWETWFVCSPSGRVRRRRETPLTIKWSDSNAS